MAFSFSNETDSSGKSGANALVNRILLLLSTAVVTFSWGHALFCCGGFGFGISLCLKNLYKSRDDLWKTLICLGVVDMVGF